MFTTAALVSGKTSLKFVKIKRARTLERSILDKRILFLFNDHRSCGY
jgi:hypothetical protein